jgi:hypothetical protein
MHEQEDPDLWVESTQLEQTVAEVHVKQGETQEVQVPELS